MSLPQEVINCVLEAENKAFATIGEDGLNVVPVSTTFVEDGKIMLVNYFFEKTAENVQDNPEVSLVCWEGLNGGYQIKGSCNYRTDEETLKPIKKWADEKHPDRTVHAVLLIDPEQIYDVGADPDSGYKVWSKT